MTATKNKYSKQDVGEACTVQCPLCVYATAETFHENQNFMT